MPPLRGCVAPLALRASYAGPGEINRDFICSIGLDFGPMMRGRPTSAGILVFRRRRGLEVLLAHPGGPFWAKKDADAWTIPKGLVEPGAALIDTARREFAEETSLVLPDGEFITLASVTQKSGKIVHAFAVEADLDLAQFASNTFEIAWPPKSGRRQAFPEIDRVAYFSVPDAMNKILTYQRPLLIELARRIG